MGTEAGAKKKKKYKKSCWGTKNCLSIMDVIDETKEGASLEINMGAAAIDQDAAAIDHQQENSVPVATTASKLGWVAEASKRVVPIARKMGGSAISAGSAAWSTMRKIGQSPPKAAQTVDKEIKAAQTVDKEISDKVPAFSRLSSIAGSMASRLAPMGTSIKEGAVAVSNSLAPVGTSIKERAVAVGNSLAPVGTSIKEGVVAVGNTLAPVGTIVQRTSGAVWGSIMSGAKTLIQHSSTPSNSEPPLATALPLSSTEETTSPSEVPAAPATSDTPLADLEAAV